MSRSDIFWWVFFCIVLLQDHVVLSSDQLRCSIYTSWTMNVSCFTVRECGVVKCLVAPVCASVCVRTVRALTFDNFWKYWSSNFISHTQVHFKVSRSRSSIKVMGQGQGHMNITKYTHSLVVRLRLKGNHVCSCIFDVCVYTTRLIFTYFYV